MITERPERHHGDGQAPVPRGTGAVDIGVGDLVTIRVVGHRAGDLAAVEAQFGTAIAAGDGPADITIRFVDDAVGAGTLRYLGPGEAGFSDDGFLVLQGRFRRQVRVRLPVADLGGPCEILCEHGVGRIPHLVAIVNLAVLTNGGLALHASSFELDGTATVATGWSKGGKTEALLAHTRRGARYVGDEWLHLHPDRRVSGIDEPLRVWDWHLDQLPGARHDISRRDRHRLQALRVAERTLASTGASPRVATALRRQRFVDVPSTTVAPAGRVVGPVPLGRVFLMTSADQEATTATPISGREIARRMAGSLAYERGPLTSIVDTYRYAFPAAILQTFDDVGELERSRLHQFLDGVEAMEVLHPHPPALDELVDAMNLVGERDR